MQKDFNARCPQVTPHPGTASAIKWKSVACAPEDFPVPLYKGHQTTFLQPSALQLSTMQHVSPQLQGLFEIKLKTKDQANAVQSWYEGALPQSGIPVNITICKQNKRIIKAESSSLICSIIICEDDCSKGETKIEICAVRKLN
jgi:hypothetical protein